MAWDNHANLLYTTTVNAPGFSGTFVEVAAGKGALYPAPPFNVTIWPPFLLSLFENGEIVRVTEINGDTLTVERAQEGTSAKNIGIGWQVDFGPTAKTFTDIETAVTALQDNILLGIDGGSPTSTYTTNIDGGSP